MTLPVTQPVLFLAIVAAVVLFVPMIFERLRIPGLVGLILAAMALGPYGAGVLERNTVIQFLGQAGLLFIVFVAGLEIDLARFARYRNHSLVFGTLSYLIPQVAGAVIAVVVLGFTLPQAILLGSMFGSHTLLAYPVASRLGITRSTPVTTSVGAAIITDASAFLVLAIIANSVAGAAGWGFWARFALMLTLFMVLVLRVLPRVARWFYRSVPDEGSRDFLFTIVMLFTFAWLAEFAGVQPIIGAFMCGLALNRLIPQRSPLMSRVQFVGRSLLVPVFMLSVGMLVDPRAIAGDARTLLIVATMVLTVVLTKLLAAFLAGRLLRYSLDECWVMFGMTVNQAAGTLAAVIVGFQIGLFDTAVVNGAIVMMLVSCLLGPICTERWGRRVAEATELAPVATDRPQRLLVPVANPATIEPLMDLALLMRDPAAQEPIYPLAIVTEGNDLDVKIAQAEKLLAHAAVRGNAGEAPIFPIARVDVNVAEGIRRVVAEQQITTVVIGWNGELSLSSRIFGTVVDQLLAQSRQQVIVAKIDRALNDTERVVLIAPRSAEREPSFAATMHLVKVLCQQLSTPLLIVGPSTATRRFQKVARQASPEVPMEFRELRGLRTAPEELPGLLRPDDLIVLLSARDHRLSWTPALETLPRHLAEEHPAVPFLVIYAAEELNEPDPLNTTADAAAPADDHELIALRRIGVRAPGETLPALLARLLAVDFAAGVLTRVANALLRSAEEHPIELAEAVFILHVHDAATASPRLYVACAPQPFVFPASGEAARVLFVLVSPAAAPPADHLALLRRIALHIRSEDRTARLRDTSDPEAVLAQLRPLNDA